MQLKRIIAIFLAAALIFSVPAIPAGAENINTFEVGVVTETTAPVSSSPIIYNSGEDVSVKISVDQNTGITYLRFVVYFNSDALEFVDYNSNSLFSEEQIRVKSNHIIYFIALSEPSKAIGDLLTVNFKTKSDYCGNVEIYTELAQNDRPENCVNDMTIVPFTAGSDSFMLHTLDTTSGVVTAPTCTEEGFTTYNCDVCEEDVVGNFVSASGHSPAEAVVENRVEPDCTTAGSYDSVVYCSTCQAELSREEKGIDALGHDLVYTDAKEATCTEIGWNAYDTCQREGCGYTTYEEIPAHGHSPAEAVVENRVEPDCTTAGSYDSVVYCSTCQAELSREAVGIDALGHDLVHTDAKDATCTEIGWNAYDTCQREGCGYTTYEEIQANGHTYGQVTVIEPEYKVDGYSTHTCEICQHEERFDITPALTYILGDANGDEQITDADAEYLLMYTFFPEDYPVNQECDFSGDGFVNDADAEYLLMFTFFPEDYPLN